jgi:VWFA-related protein
MRRPTTVLTCALATAAALGAQAPTTQAPTFRSAVDLVDVDVSVLDRNRLPVLGLEASDFTVIEDGTVQPIVAFSAVRLPSREMPPARWMAEVASDVLTNTFPREGRLVALLIDRSVAPEHSPVARSFAEAAIDELRPGDLAAIAFAASGVPQNFTADRARLRRTLQQPFVDLPAAQARTYSDCNCGTCTLDSISRVAEAMSQVRQRRKMLFIISSRIAVHSNGACSGVLTDRRRRAMRALEEGNVTVHVFDPSGLQTLAPSASVRSFPPNRGIQAHLRRTGDLQILPEHTGGRYVTNAARPSDPAAQLFRESDSYYVLGFQPRSAGRQPQFRSIQVKVNRPQVTLQARRGYYSKAAATRDTTTLPSSVPESLRAAINGLWPSTAVPMTMNLIPLAKPALDGAVLAVTVHVRQEVNQPDSMGLDLPRPGSPTRFSVLAGAFDPGGRATAFDRQTLMVTPTQAGDRVGEYQAVLSLGLEPGRYEIRAAVQDETLERTGSVYGYVDIPDFRRQAVSLSGVALHVRPEVPSTPLGSLGAVLPVIPTGKRQFRQTDEVRGFVRLYQGLSRPATPGYLTTEIENDHEQVVYRRETRVTLESMGAGRATDIEIDVPVNRLPPGAYLLAIETRHGNEIARRDVRFDVVAGLP